MRKVLFSLVAGAASALVACRSAARPAPEQVPVAVLFSAAETHRFLRQLESCERFPGSDIHAQWTPDAQDTAGLAMLLRARLAGELPRDSVLTAEAFRFQYFGVVRDQRRRIFVNGFHEFIHQTMSRRGYVWMRAPLVVCDSTNGAFQAEYDPQTRELTPLQFY
jgi:hypothetical protein